LESFCSGLSGQTWGVNPGDGAFYGPKIDIQLTDALKRKHQCATIQLDFQLPIRFKLSYKDSSEGFAAPCIIHRAILGSVERMMAVLIEHTGGKWPFWLSPRQVMVIPVHAEHDLAYARKVGKVIHDAGYYVDVDDSNSQLPKKVRNAQLDQYNFILVVGPKDAEKDAVTVRERDTGSEATYQIPTAELLRKFEQLVNEHK